MAALADLVEGLARWQLWGLVGWQDIKQRYRRSLLGPFWLTFSMAILVGTLGVLYSVLFGVPIAEYLPYITLGFLIWELISSNITDGCMAFINSAQFIKQIKLPLSTFIYQAVWRHFIIFGHNFLIYVIVAVIFGIWAGPVGLLVLPGLLIVTVNAVWVGLLLGIICTRFRDVPPIMTSLIRVAFFLTPIIWMPERLGSYIGLVHINPFFHFIELVRAPLLGQAPSLLNWQVGLAMTAGGWLVTFLVFRRFRSRIPYWL